VKNLNALLLSAGFGTRLMPLTKHWPKCLMPIHGVPILEHWLSTLNACGAVKNVYVNTHYHSDEVEEFLSLQSFKNWVTTLYESKLSGTAGIIKNNSSFFLNKPLMVIHSDNWFDFEISNFLRIREIAKSKNCLITMLTFNCFNPEEVGVVELTSEGIVTNIFEKESTLKGSKANGAIYIFEREVVNWICKTENISDISTHVLPKFLNKILTSHTESYFRDIGSLPMLIAAQSDPAHILKWDNSLYWNKNVKFKKINTQVELILGRSSKLSN
jgi:mannose-1-phosphate guanylyltransferase